MGIMDMVKKWNENKKVKSEKFKEMQEDAKLQHILEERQKSSNERELESWHNKQREKVIKEELDKIHKVQSKESWKGTSFSKGTSMLKNDRPILKEKNIFKDDKKIPFIQKGGMFFK